jgi:hypothetical protein
VVTNSSVYTKVVSAGPNQVWVIRDGAAWFFDGANWSNTFVSGNDVVPIAPSTALVMTDSQTASIAFGGGAMSPALGVNHFSGLGHVQVFGPDDLWIANDNGLSHYDGERMNDLVLQAPGENMAVWGDSDDDLFYAGASGIYHFDGHSASLDYPLSGGILMDIWGTDPGHITAVGGSGLIVTRSGPGWATSTLPTGTLYSVYGTGTDVFTVGESGAIYHDAGAGLQRETSGVSSTLFSVWAAAADDVFAVGDGGVILHRDATGWSSMTSPTIRSLKAVKGASGHDVFALADGNVLLHYDGAHWTPVNAPSVPFFGTNNLAITPNGDTLFLIGSFDIQRLVRTVTW